VLGSLQNEDRGRRFDWPLLHKAAMMPPESQLLNLTCNLEYADRFQGDNKHDFESDCPEHTNPLHASSVPVGKTLKRFEGSEVFILRVTGWGTAYFISLAVVTEWSYARMR
jgi:hypothetical protein